MNAFHGHGVHPLAPYSLVGRANAHTAMTGEERYVRRQDGDDCDLVASLRHQFTLGRGVLLSLLFTPVVTTPSPRVRLYEGSYTSPSLFWDSNTDYPGQSVPVNTTFEYRIGRFLEQSKSLLFSVEDDAVTQVSVFTWAWKVKAL